MNNKYGLNNNNFYIKIYNNMPYIDNSACIRLIINMNNFIYQYQMKIRI